MRNTLETTETPGRVLMISNAGRMVCAVVWAARDHAVGEPQVHHHRAEVRHVGDGVGRLLVRDALVLAQLGVLLGEAVHDLRVERAQHLRGAQVEAELDGATAHLRLVAEDRQVGDAAGEHGRRGPQHAVVAAFGQHDALTAGAGALQELVLEHQRRHDGGVGQAEHA
jgi:hypothetical protein